MLELGKQKAITQSKQSEVNITPKPIFDSMREDDKPPVENEMEEEQPKTLWDMFMDYVKTKDKRERKQFLETVQ